MRWLKKDRLVDTEKATCVLKVPERETGTRWTLKDLGFQGPPRAMSDVVLWLSEDGTWFMTNNPKTIRLNEDQTDYTAYRDWSDPHRTHDDLAQCCRVITERQARRLCERFMAISQYLKVFPEEEQVKRGTQLPLCLARQPGADNDIDMGKVRLALASRTAEGQDGPRLVARR